MKRRKPIRKRSERGKLLSQCDQLMRQIIMARDEETCQKCGKKAPQVVIQDAHVLSKGHYQRLRYEPLNHVALCVADHIFGAHKDPADFMAWFEQKYPGRIDQLRVLAAVAPKLDLKELRIGLELEVAELRAKA